MNLSAGRIVVARGLALFAAGLGAALADPPRALPLESAGTAPAHLDVAVFAYRSSQQDHKVVVTTSPRLIRFDEPAERYSVLYDPAAQVYTGLEHSNYTYWTFSWPEVKSAVEASKRGEKHLQEMANEGFSQGSASSSPTNDATATTNSPVNLGTGDDSGYVWRPTTEKKRIADLDCTRWTGESVSGEDCEVWCYPGALPRVAEAVAQLRQINEPMALVPVREVVPDFIFTVYDSLAKGGQTPLLISWGAPSDRTTFHVAEQKAISFDAKLFVVPKNYVKTTLITMDGLIPEQPMPGLRGSAVAPRPDHLNSNPSVQPGLENR